MPATTFDGAAGVPAEAGLFLLALTGAVAVAATGLAWIVRRVQEAPCLPLFVKLSRHQVEHQSVRTAIVEALRQDPGMTTQELRNEVGIAWGATVHHLRVLERHGLVGSVNWGRNRHWFHSRFPANERALIAAVRHAPARKILEAIWERPGRPQEQVAKDVGLHRATIIFHARKLEELRLISRRREAGHVRYFPLQNRPTRPFLPLGAPEPERVANQG